MKLYKNLMVVFRGHVRTWEYVRKPVLDFYDSLAENVDYYVSTWKMEDFSLDLLTESFAGRNLVKLLPVTPAKDLYSGWMGPAYQSFRLLPYKRLREREIGQYDAVIDTRLDVIVGQNYYKDYGEFGLTIKDIPPAKIKPNTLYTDRINFDMEQEPGIKIPRPNDHWFMMSSNMFEAFTERFIRKEKYSAHEEFYFLCQEESWNLEEAIWAHTLIVRPNILVTGIDPYDLLSVEKTNKRIEKGLLTYNDEWIVMPIEERNSFYRNTGINPADYECQVILVNDDAEGEQKP